MYKRQELAEADRRSRGGASQSGLPPFARALQEPRPGEPHEVLNQRVFNPYDAARDPDARGSGDPPRVPVTVPRFSFLTVSGREETAARGEERADIVPASHPVDLSDWAFALVGDDDADLA